jgi:GT2 family glycosyltransferase
MEKLSIFIINYNGGDILLDVIKSLKEQDYSPISIMLIDDGSTDKSVSMVQQSFPDIEIHGFGYNTKSLNRLRRLAIDTANSRYVFIIDNDIVLEKNCISNLMSVMQRDNSVGVCTPRLMYYSDKKKVNISWTKLHYICNSISPKRDTYTVPESVTEDTVGGGIMLLDRNKVNEIGTIDDSFPMGWGDDADIYIRMKIAGYKTLYVPNAVGYHYAKEWSSGRSYRAFGQVYNRWVMIISFYQFKSIILLMPAFIVYDIFLFFMLLLKGLGLTYFKALLSFFKNFKKVLKKRKAVQLTRRVKDKDFLTVGPLYIPTAHLSSSFHKIGIACLNTFFLIYWYLVKYFL